MDPHNLMGFDLLIPMFLSLWRHFSIGSESRRFRESWLRCQFCEENPRGNHVGLKRWASHGHILVELVDFLQMMLCFMSVTNLKDSITNVHVSNSTWKNSKERDVVIKSEEDRRILRRSSQTSYSYRVQDIPIPIATDSYVESVLQPFIIYTKW